MFTPVVPDGEPAAAAAPRTGSMRKNASFRQLTIQTHNVEGATGDAGPRKSIHGPLAAVSEGGATFSPIGRSASKRRLSIKQPSSRTLSTTNTNTNGGGSDADPKMPTPTAAMGRRQSMKFFRRASTRRSMNATKKETPPHLVKLLQRTPEHKALVDAVKATLSEEPSLRNEGSLDLLYDWMLQNCKQYSNNIFGSAPEYIRREICRQMRLIRMLSNQMIIRQGDTGDRCYIVIDGLVDVYIKKKETLVTASNESSTPTHAAAMLAKEYGDMVANLGPGAMFGEIVLMNPSARRNASILASQYTEACDLICLERADYIRLVRGASMEASHYNQAEILDQMYLFQGWEKQDKMKIVSAMRSVHFTSNDYLYRAGSDAKWMYIISSGEVVERVNWTVGKATTGINSLVSGSAVVTANSNNSSAPAASSATSQRLHSNNSEQPEKKVNIDLLLVGAGDVVGELPFVKAKMSALFEIKTVTDVHALALDRRTFETMILNANAATHPACHATLLKLQKLTDEREDWRQQRLACGAAYPSAHISITWQLMRMSNLRCPRCGQRGHLASDLRRCALPGSPKRASVVSTAKKSTLKHGVQLPPLLSMSGTHHKKTTLIGSKSATPRRDSATRDLLDESYLPSAREQLEQCRLDTERSRITMPVLASYLKTTHETSSPR